MPILVIHGVPMGMDNAQLHEVARRLREAVAQIKELRVRTDQVAVRMPADLLALVPGERREIACFVEALRSRPERTPLVLVELARSITEVLRTVSPHDTALVEVIIRRENSAGLSCGWHIFSSRSRRKPARKTA